MDGLLIVDKPSGPTSHDIVAIVRRLLGTRAGHTGTLDPLASGVLPIVVGRATRLAQFMSGADKTYEATIRLGMSTDTCDAMGQPVGPLFEGTIPSVEAVESALDRFRGTFEQQPPAYSAKKIGGRPSYALARRARARQRATDASQPLDTAPAVISPAVLPPPVPVTAHSIEVLHTEGADVRVRIRCSAGFYVRALAHDLGTALGTGAHLTTLRRTTVAGIEGTAVPLEALRKDDGREAAAAALTPLGAMLPHLPTVTLVAGALPRTQAGRDVDPADASSGFVEATAALRDGAARHVRLLDPSGGLVAIAESARTSGLLHPFVVLM